MPNLVKTSPEAKILFNWQGPSGASPGIAGAVQFTPEGMLNGLAHKSDVYDLGEGTRNNLFQWRAKSTVRSGTATVGGTIEIYFYTSDDGTDWDGNLGSGNAAVSSQDKRRNLQHVGSLSVDQAATGVPFITSGFIMNHARFLGVVWYNYTGGTLSSIPGENFFQLTPVPDVVEQF